MKTAARLIASLACAGAALALPLAAGASGGDDDFSTFAGTGTSGYAGDGGPANEAELASPHSVAPAPGGGYLIADADNNRIRKVDPDGLITTVAGTGTAGFNGDALPATMAELDHPSGLARTSDGGFLIADTNNHRIRKVLPGLGLVTTVAGTGTAGDGGIGLAATLTDLNSPTAVAATSDGGFLIADNGNNKIRKVSPLGLISTVAGDGSAGFGGDGGDATLAQLSCPNDVAVTHDGGFLIADTGNHRIREVAGDGTISTVAGDGTDGNNGDWGDATAAQLSDPNGVDVIPGDGFLIADTGNDTIRRVREDGKIKPAVNLRVTARDGDGMSGALSSDSLDAPLDVLAVADALLVADTGSNRVRLIGALPQGQVPVDVPRDPAPPLPSDDNPTSVLPEPDQPTVGEDLNVARIEGTIRVRLPGAGGFVRLDKDASIPFGSVVDAASGTVTLTTARNRDGETQRAAFKGSLFKVTQDRTTRPVTDLELRGGNFGTCSPRTARGAGVASAAARRGRARRHLWGSGHGRFRTIGRHGAATVRGTIWLTSDRCDGTLVRVRRGRVQVRDFRARKSVFVRAGHSYLSRVHPRRARRR